ncbi:protein SOB FIVE-LIKE 1-like [Impatiens glandulifera]|uniref:protein SOB FIVE-LIKE 1-like n=1 Tax=Impatiens glandulifera TaxID=253017 RepID=UPI001FB11A19|nr:protein SOB FIVE-LIKE 1-like [Impatiens glandulifera]
MDYSQNTGEEECYSCESGWTMYIGSPISDDDDDDDDDNEEQDEKHDDDEEDGHRRGAKREDESDDSMASDASSGQSRVKEQYLKKKAEMKKMPSKDQKGKINSTKGRVLDNNNNNKTSLGQPQDCPKMPTSSLQSNFSYG